MYGPTGSDKDCFDSLGETPESDEYPHLYRWHKHIASYESEFSKLKAAPDKEICSLREALEAEDEEFNLEETPEEEKEREERNKKQREEAKQKMVSKPKKAAKSIVTLQVKPWEDTTDMAELEANVRKIEMDGLVWGKSQLLPVGYGIRMLQINFVIEDEKVSVVDLEDKIREDEEHVQSTDVAAMQKL